MAEIFLYLDSSMTTTGYRQYNLTIINVSVTDMARSHALSLVFTLSKILHETVLNQGFIKATITPMKEVTIPYPDLKLDKQACCPDS